MSNRITEVDLFRVSALTNAAKLSPYVHEMTIGPNSSYCPENTSTGDEMETPFIVERKKKEKVSDEIIETELGNVHYQKLLHEIDEKRRDATDQYFREMLENVVAKRNGMLRQLNRQKEEEFERVARDRKVKEMELLQEWSLDREARFSEEGRRYDEIMRQTMDRQLEYEREIAISILTVEPEPVTYSQQLESSVENNKHSEQVLCPSEEVLTVPSILAPVDLKIDVQPPTPTRAVALGENIEEKPMKLPEPQPKLKPIITEVIPEHKLKFCSETSYKIYTEHQAFLKDFESQCAPIVNDVSLKRFRFDLQKAVNTPINSVSAVSGPQILEKYEKLYKLLSGERITVADTTVCAAGHPQGILFCMNTLAKRIVLQGEVQVEAAFPLAVIVVSLWSQFPQLATLTKAYFYQACPYLIPMFPPQSVGQSNEDFYRSRGYRYDENGTVEKQDIFLKRMGGIFKLFAAIWITKPPRVQKHPHGLACGWRWLAAFINLKPEVDISATLLHDFLTICGSDFYKNYGRQFSKVLYALSTDYIKQLDKINEGGPKLRLEVFLQKIHSTGTIPPPKGFISKYSW